MKRFGYLAAVCLIIGAALLSCTSPIQPSAGAGSRQAVAAAAADDGDTEVSGTVANIVNDGTNTTFTVSGSNLTIVAANTLLAGLTGFGPGVVVDVSGTIDLTTGFLVAAEIEIELEANIMIVGPATGAVATPPGSESVTVNGVTVPVSTSTKLMDKSKKGNPNRSNLGDFLGGISESIIMGTPDPLTILAFQDPSGNVVAIKVTILKRIPKFAVLEGPATLADPGAGTLSILGEPIDLTNTTFEDATGDVRETAFLTEVQSAITASTIIIVDACGPKGGFETPFGNPPGTDFIAAHVSLGD